MITKEALIEQGFVCSNCKWCKYIKGVPHDYSECTLTDDVLNENEFFCAWFESKDSK